MHSMKPILDKYSGSTKCHGYWEEYGGSCHNYFFVNVVFGMSLNLMRKLVGVVATCVQRRSGR